MLDLNNQTKQIILDELKTQDRAFLFLSELDHFASLLYRREAEGNSPVTFSDLLGKIVPVKDLENVSKDSLSQFFIQVHEWLTKTEPVRFKLAFRPSSDFVSKLYLWTKDSIGELNLINVEVDPEILGGVIVTVNGKYVDLGLNKITERYFASNKNAILSILQK